MRILEASCDLDQFFTRVRTDSKRTLMLDYDGTLAPFRVERDQAVPYPKVREMLETLLASNHTRIVVVSGRSARELVPLLGLEQPLEIWGSHGWERLRPNGDYTIEGRSAESARGLNAARAWVDERSLHQHFEEKPASVALHWRGLPPEHVVELRDSVLEHWRAIAEETGLVAHTFDGGVELRIPGRDKGFAVHTILDEQGPEAVAAYLGDDLTDEDAFAALKGRGLSVLVRNEFRPTSAEVWLQPPGEMLDFLERWHTVAQPAA